MDTNYQIEAVCDGSAFELRRSRSCLQVWGASVYYLKKVQNMDRSYVCSVEANDKMA